MQKNILITGATDGIGLETAKLLASNGHNIILHGRNATKLQQAQEQVQTQAAGTVATVQGDLSLIRNIEPLAEHILSEHPKIDALINNAGVYTAQQAITKEQLDIRFAVNTLAPYLLTQQLMPAFNAQSRVVNVSSAAQLAVNIDALRGNWENTTRLGAGEAYAQSKLAITMWTRHMAQSQGNANPIVVAVNPGSMLGSKMVKDAYGVSGGDLEIGADILQRAATSEEFAAASGQYFDNDRGSFASPHLDALDNAKNQQLVDAIEEVIASLVERIKDNTSR